MLYVCCIHSFLHPIPLHACMRVVQVWKDRHQAVARDVIDATAKRISLGSPQQMNGSPSQLAAQARPSKSPEGAATDEPEQHPS